MVFLGAFFGADELSLSVTPTHIEDINRTEVFEAVVDTLYSSQETDSEMTKEIPTEWDFNTVMIATYDEDTAATSVHWTLDTVSHLIIKRKLASDYNWTTIKIKEIKVVEDFYLSDIDITPTTGDYLYCVVPSLNGKEGSYIATSCRVDVQKLTLTDITGTWGTYITDGSCNTVNETPGTFLSTLNGKYASYVSNSIANYQKITVAGEFYPVDGRCNYDKILDDGERIRYIQDFITFLTNRYPKVLKAVDGRKWLVMVDNGVSDSMKDYYKSREISFTCMEVGNPDATEDLVIAGIIDVPEEYW